MKKTTLKIAISIVAFIIGVSGVAFWFIQPFLLNETVNVSPPENVKTENAEEYAVYSAAINSLFIQDKDFVNLPLISNQTSSLTDNAFGLIKPTFEETVLGMKDIYPSVNQEVLSDYVAKQRQSVKLNTNFSLPLEYILTNETEPKNLSFIRLSRVGFNKERNQAFVCVEYLCPLCGFGEQLLLEKVDENWYIKEKFPTWVS
jgi:hypothetical protein